MSEEELSASTGMFKLLTRYAAGEDIRSLDWIDNGYRARLRRRRLLDYEPFACVWTVTDAGRAALKTGAKT